MASHSSKLLRTVASDGASLMCARQASTRAHLYFRVASASRAPFSSSPFPRATSASGYRKASPSPSTSSPSPSTSYANQPSRVSRPDTASVPTTTSNSPMNPTSSYSSPSSSDPLPPIADLSTGLSDTPLTTPEESLQIDWTRSFHGLSAQPFSKEAADILLAPIPTNDIEVKPDGIIYLPEIKYRRILNRAFGPGGWGLAPRGETIVSDKSVTREYALVAHGRLVSIARGEQDYFSPEGIPTATEGCKSNALMRCCKDLGVASELWDPRHIRTFMREHAKQVWVEHVVSKKRKQHWLRRDDEVRYPFKETR